MHNRCRQVSETQTLKLWFDLESILAPARSGLSTKFFVCGVMMQDVFFRDLVKAPKEDTPVNSISRFQVLSRSRSPHTHPWKGNTNGGAAERLSNTISVGLLSLCSTRVVGMSLRHLREGRFFPDHVACRLPMHNNDRCSQYNGDMQSSLYHR